MLILSVAVLGASLTKVLDVSEGFRTERLITFDYSLPAGVPRLDMDDPDAWAAHIVQSGQFDDSMKRRLTSLPGIEAVAISGSPMLEGFSSIIGVTYVEGREPEREGRSVGAVTVDPECFETLGFTVVSGRGFTAADGLDGPPVVVLNRRAADVFFDGQDPVGRRFGVGAALPGRAIAEVVGVVENVLHESPDQLPAPVAYYSTRERRHGRHVLVRTAGDPADAVGPIRAALYDLDPTVAMSNVATMEERMRRSVGDRGMVLVLLGLFGGVAVLLAAVGTWAVVSYAVADRTRELAVRVALGAKGRRVVQLVVGRVALIASVGGILGVMGGLAGTRVLETFLFDTSPHDPIIFLAGGGFLFAVIFLSGYLPARRATRVDPAQALRALE
jgi:predicted permease